MLESLPRTCNEITLQTWPTGHRARHYYRPGRSGEVNLQQINLPIPCSFNEAGIEIDFPI